MSACLPVSGSVAVTLNSLRPRRSSTSTVQLPASSAVTWIGWSRPGIVTETVAPGLVVPRRV